MGHSLCRLRKDRYENITDNDSDLVSDLLCISSNGILSLTFIENDGTIIENQQLREVLYD